MESPLDPAAIVDDLFGPDPEPFVKPEDGIMAQRTEKMNKVRRAIEHKLANTDNPLEDPDTGTKVSMVVYGFVPAYIVDGEAFEASLFNSGI